MNKALIKKFLVAALGAASPAAGLLGLLVAGSAFAQQIPVALSGSELEFEVRFTGPVKVRHYCETFYDDKGKPIKMPPCWKQTPKGLVCVVQQPPDYVDASTCYISITAPNALFVNEYVYPASGEVEANAYNKNDVVTNSDLAEMKHEKYPDSFGAIFVNQLLSAQRNTVFSGERGRCYSYEVRFIADQATKVISNIWMEKVAASCP